MKNPGKAFEEDWKKSVPDDVYYYRFRDGTANFAGTKNENTRFQQTNVCDCLMYDNAPSQLYLLELKSHKGKSIPFTAFRANQLEGLAEAHSYGVITGAIINMRDVEKTYFVGITDITDIMNVGERKSIPLDYMEQKGYAIKSYRKKVRHRYDIKAMMEDLRLANTKIY